MHKLFVVQVIDRIKLDKLLQKLPSWQHDHLPLCRPPRCITADDFGDVEELYRELSGAGGADFELEDGACCDYVE